VRELVDGLRRIGFADPDFRSSDLIRLNVLHRLRRDGLLDDDLCWLGAAKAPAVV
jgi:UDP-glucose 4-epimerase